MKRKTNMLLCIFFFIAALAYGIAITPHEFNNQECTICHTGSGSGSSPKNSSITTMCLTCHTTLFEEGYMHPVDIKPRTVIVPFDFPLSKSGTMTCNTCHDVHAPYETPLGVPSNFLRRNETGKSFCNICHMNTIATTTGHQSMFQKAHLSSKYTETDHFAKIDSLSRNCISCHDGTFAASVEVRTGNWRHSRDYLKFDKGSKHPIGMFYEKAQMQNKKVGLKAIGLVDKRIRFFENGKIGCGSCHDPFSSNPNKLVISTKNEQLCLCCHKM